METTFDRLTTNDINERCKPYAEQVYRLVFPGCTIQRHEKGDAVGLQLDKHHAIDGYIHLPKSGTTISIQEKFREHAALRWTEFTQEYMNGTGTAYESPGEWFHLDAQVYFLAFENLYQKGFEKWLLLDVPKYKWIVEQEGGLDKIGTYQCNSKHGRASFYAIPIAKLGPAIITDYRQYKPSHLGIQRPLRLFMGE